MCTHHQFRTVQNAAIRLVTGTRRCNHITPVLHQLHWLPVRQRVDFKVATFVHWSLSGISPTYLADDCRLVADARERRLRSTESRTCVVARTYSSFGDRAFAAAGPVLWNSLPLHCGQSIPAVAKDIFVWIAGPWRSVNYLNCAA